MASVDLAQRIERLETEHAQQLAQRDAIIAQQEAVIAKQQAFIELLQQQLQEQAERFHAEVQELKRKLNKSSKNSNQPPSTDQKDKPRKSKDEKAKKKNDQKASKKRGGQTGHAGAHRALLPPEQVDRFEEHFPDHCENCFFTLARTPEQAPVRHQVTDLIDFKPHITEHRRHKVTCPKCKKSTRAKPTGLPFRYHLGPRLCSILALLTGVYHLSRRAAQRLIEDLFNLKISLGAISNVEARVSEALVGAYDEAFEKAQNAKVKHTDGSAPRRRGKETMRMVV